MPACTHCAQDCALPLPHPPPQVLPAVNVALDGGSPALGEAALALVRDVAGAVDPSALVPALPALLPRLLRCMAAQAREMVVMADEALAALLAHAPPDACVPLLAAHLPAPGTPPAAAAEDGALVHAAVRSVARVVARLRPEALATVLEPALLPGLRAAYCSPLAEVRKATVDCLVAMWLVRLVRCKACEGCAAAPPRWLTCSHHAHTQVLGDVLVPHLQQLSASQLKLLELYHARARGDGVPARGDA